MMTSFEGRDGIGTQTTRSIAERLPHIAGWMVEFVTFERLHSILQANFGRSEIRIGLIRGMRRFLYAVSIDAL